eukprot:318-Chlamydomonas_euryale.AAC.1
MCPWLVLCDTVRCKWGKWIARADKWIARWDKWIASATCCAWAVHLTMFPTSSTTRFNVTLCPNQQQHLEDSAA